jgi:D-arabinose 5-phosphate isomerase GutQ
MGGLMEQMTGINVFQDAFQYLINCVKMSIEKLDKVRLASIFKIMIEARNTNRDVIVDGKGRSLQSMLLLEDCLEHNGFHIILPASNANLRPWKEGDLFFFNTGSGSGSTIDHALAAKNDGLHVIGMTYNRKLLETFPNVLIIETSNTESRNHELAPLGTEFEIASAVIGVCVAYSLKDTVELSMKEFGDSTAKILKIYDATYDYLETELESLMTFIRLISEYLTTANDRKIYFLGVGRNEIINRVAAIRYGHLSKLPHADLRVIYEGHWDLRKPGDLAILMSGSGSTSQIIDFGMQAFISGMKIFGITSFKQSSLGKFSARVNGCLMLPGREDFFSMYNDPVDARRNYLPAFELNCYICLDALLAQIAHNFGITETDMKKCHRSKVLE